MLSGDSLAPARKNGSELELGGRKWAEGSETRTPPGREASETGEAGLSQAGLLGPRQRKDFCSLTLGNLPACFLPTPKSFAMIEAGP